MNREEYYPSFKRLSQTPDFSKFLKAIGEKKKTYILGFVNGASGIPLAELQARCNELSYVETLAESVVKEIEERIAQAKS